MSRRNTELALLIIAAPIVILLFGSLVVANNGELSINTLGVPIGIFLAFIGAHIAMRRFAENTDPAILPITFALSGIGIAYVTRLAPDLAVRQDIWLFLGIACMVAILIWVRKIEMVSNFKYTLIVIGVLLLLSPMLPVLGTEIYGSRIWLTFAGFSFQPGELAKIFIVLFLGGYLAQNREMLSVFTVKLGPLRLPDFRTLLPLLIMWGISMVIVIFEKDLGSAMVVFLVFLVMLYVATGKVSYVVIGFILAAAGGIAAFMLYSHVQIRIDTWLNPFADPTGAGYQLVQSLYSIADGGMIGVGVGQGMAEQIPIVESDFIFSAIAEELGLLGAVGVLLLFVMFAVRGMVISARAKSDVAALIAVGLTSIIVLQAFIIVGGVTRLIPLTGLTLPFISQGGSSLLSSFIAVGLLARCGDEATGIHTELTQGTTGIISGMSELGRVALGRRLTHMMVVFSVLFAVLIANLTLIMLVQAETYKTMPNNNHTIAHAQENERGVIYTSDGTVLAQSIYNEETGKYDRDYPAGTLASHIVGYSSVRYGTAGLERTYNEVLQGTRVHATWMDVVDELSGKGARGNDIKLTIDAGLQQVAQDALGEYNGACIVMDPRTGAILAMASNPTYAANDVEALLEAQSGDALVNRATQALYAPGSTFKVVTLASAFENDVARENTRFKSPGSMEIGNGKVTNFDGHEYGNITLSRALELSSNTVFGQVGAKIGAAALVRTASNFGFNQSLDFDTETTTSLMPDPKEMTEWETAWAADGQPVGDHKSPAGPQASVLQMAMVACGIANNGVIMKPYLVDSVYDAEGEKTQQTNPITYNRAVSENVAKRVRKVMEGVVENGTATGAQIPGVKLAAKTGTAETGKDVDDSWFVCMGPSDDCSVVVAMVLEQAGESAATYAATPVIEAALRYQGDL